MLAVAKYSRNSAKANPAEACPGCRTVIEVKKRRRHVETVHHSEKLREESNASMPSKHHNWHNSSFFASFFSPKYNAAPRSPPFFSFAVVFVSRTRFAMGSKNPVAAVDVVAVATDGAAQVPSTSGFSPFSIIIHTSTATVKSDWSLFP